MMRLIRRAIGSWLVLGWAAMPAWSDETTWYGGIEIGSNGIKMVAIPVDEKGRIDLVRKKEVSTTDAVDSDPAKRIQGLKIKKTADIRLVDLDKDGNFRPELIQEAREAIENFHTYLSGELKIPPSRLYVVASSGLISARKPANYPALAAAVAKATGGEESLLQIDQEKEVELMVRGAIPREHINDAILLDVGGGNAKVGYFEAANGLSVERYIHLTTKVEGSTTFARAVREELKSRGLKSADFGRVAEELRRERVERIKDDVGGKAGLVNQPRVYLSGGVVWAILSLTNAEAAVNQELAVEFPLKDLRAFRDRLRETGRIEPPDLAGLQKSVQLKAEANLRAVRLKFKPEDLLAGSEILLAFAEALEFEEQKKSLYFTKSGVVAWIVGYIETDRAKPPK